MLEMQRFFKTLQLLVLFSFFLWTFSYISLIFLSALTTMLTNTFLSSFISIVDIIFRVIFTILNFIAKVFFIGGLIGLLVIFINDFVIDPVKEQFKSN